MALSVDVRARRAPDYHSQQPPALHLTTFRDERPHPQVRALLRLISLGSPARSKEYSLKEARDGLRFLVWAYGVREKVAEVVDKTINSSAGPIPIRIYKPKKTKEKLPVFLWFHGGGFILGDLFVGDGTCRTIANRSGAIVVAVDYRKAPEFDLYTGRKDCLAAVSWIAEHGHKIGVDPSRIAVGGDSAGGNLAAVVAQQCVRHGGPKLSLQVLAYPATHLGTDYRAMMDLPDGYLLTTESVDWFRRHLGKFDVNDPLLSPLLADDLKGLCPALMITAGYDPLCTEGIAYAEKLAKAGVVTKTFHYPGQIHGFLSLDAVLKEGGDALDRIGEALQIAFGTKESNGAATAVTKFYRQQPSFFRQLLLDTIFTSMMTSEFFLDSFSPLK